MLLPLTKPYYRDPKKAPTQTMRLMMGQGMDYSYTACFVQHISPFPSKLHTLDPPREELLALPCYLPKNLIVSIFHSGETFKGTWTLNCSSNQPDVPLKMLYLTFVSTVSAEV